MRKLLICLLALGLPAMALAESYTLAISYYTNGVYKGFATNVIIRGFVEEILIDAPAAGVTGTVAVYCQPELATMATYNLAANTISNDFRVRPVQVQTDTTGTNITTYEKYFLYGERVYLSVTNVGAVSTGITWKAIIKTSGGRF